MKTDTDYKRILLAHDTDEIVQRHPNYEAPAKPEDPSKIRFLKNGEVIQKGDVIFDRGIGAWISAQETIGMQVNASLKTRVARSVVAEVVKQAAKQLNTISWRLMQEGEIIQRQDAYFPGKDAYWDLGAGPSCEVGGPVTQLNVGLYARNLDEDKATRLKATSALAQLSTFELLPVGGLVVWGNCIWRKDAWVGVTSVEVGLHVTNETFGLYAQQTEQGKAKASLPKGAELLEEGERIPNTFLLYINGGWETHTHTAVGSEARLAKFNVGLYARAAADTLVAKAKRLLPRGYTLLELGACIPQERALYFNETEWVEVNWRLNGRPVGKNDVGFWAVREETKVEAAARTMPSGYELIPVGGAVPNGSMRYFDGEWEPCFSQYGLFPENFGLYARPIVRKKSPLELAAEALPKNMVLLKAKEQLPSEYWHWHSGCWQRAEHWPDVVELLYPENVGLYARLDVAAPEGYRLLGSHEEVLKGDYYHAPDCPMKRCHDSVGSSVRTLQDGRRKDWHFFRLIKTALETASDALPAKYQLLSEGDAVLGEMGDISWSSRKIKGKWDFVELGCGIQLRAKDVGFYARLAKKPELPRYHYWVPPNDKVKANDMQWSGGCWNLVRYDGSFPLSLREMRHYCRPMMARPSLPAGYREVPVGETVVAKDQYSLTEGNQNWSSWMVCGSSVGEVVGKPGKRHPGFEHWCIIRKIEAQKAKEGYRLLDAKEVIGKQDLYVTNERDEWKPVMQSVGMTVEAANKRWACGYALWQWCTPLAEKKLPEGCYYMRFGQVLHPSDMWWNADLGQWVPLPEDKAYLQLSFDDECAKTYVRVAYGEYSLYHPELSKTSRWNPYGIDYPVWDTGSLATGNYTSGRWTYLGITNSAERAEEWRRRSQSDVRFAYEAHGHGGKYGKDFYTLWKRDTCRN